MTKKRKPQQTPKPWGPFWSFPSEAGGDTRVHINNRYIVHATPFAGEGLTGHVHLSIRNKNRTAIRDWRHFQRIKNEICGAEREAIELYPAESRLIDEANQYHLWVFPEGFALPVGFDQRVVGSQATASLIGAVQRDFDKDDPNYPDSLIPSDTTHLKLRGATNE
mgnify:FL=1